MLTSNGVIRPLGITEIITTRMPLYLWTSGSSFNGTVTVELIFSARYIVYASLCDRLIARSARSFDSLNWSLTLHDDNPPAHNASIINMIASADGQSSPAYT
jgi:hypothetical protein